MPIPLGVLAVAGAGAAGGGNSYDLLETTTLGTAAASVTFSNLNNYSDYKHLQVRYTVRTSRAQSFDTMLTRLNSDSGSNYARHSLVGDGSSVSSEASTSQTSVNSVRIIGNNATANIFAAGVVDILDFSNSSKNTTLRFLTGRLETGLNEIGLTSGLWNNTAAVTSVQFLPGTGPNFNIGCRFSLYGIK
jgi:hypothetical protein